MNAKISVFVICVEAIIYVLLYNLHHCTFKKINRGQSPETLWELRLFTKFPYQEIR